MTEREEFERGRAIGEINARLDGHDRNFKAINNNIGKLTDTVITTNFSLDRLVQQEESREESAKSIAAAVKEVTEVRHAESMARWTPVTRTVTVLSGVGAIGTIVSVLVLIFR